MVPVGLSPLSSRPAADWAREQRTSLHVCVPKRNAEDMTTQPSVSVDQMTLSLRTKIRKIYVLIGVG